MCSTIATRKAEARACSIISGESTIRSGVAARSPCGPSPATRGRRWRSGRRRSRAPRSGLVVSRHACSSVLLFSRSMSNQPKAGRQLCKRRVHQRSPRSVQPPTSRRAARASSASASRSATRGCASGEPQVIQSSTKLGANISVTATVAAPTRPAERPMRERTMLRSRLSNGCAWR